MYICEHAKHQKVNEPERFMYDTQCHAGRGLVAADAPWAISNCLQLPQQLSFARPAPAVHAPSAMPRV